MTKITMDMAINEFDNYIKTKGIRRSVQRNKILEIFLANDEHLSTADIYELVKEKYPGIGFATIYRAMKLICESGLGEELDIGDGVTRYEHKLGHKHHDHLICIRCKKCIEAVDPEIEKLQEKMSKNYDFTIVKHKLQIFGFCRDCRDLMKNGK